jgi:hypothetical protein
MREFTQALIFQHRYEMLPDLAPGLKAAPLTVPASWLPGFHRAVPSTPLDENQDKLLLSGAMVARAKAFVNHVCHPDAS